MNAFVLLTKDSIAVPSRVQLQALSPVNQDMA